MRDKLQVRKVLFDRVMNIAQSNPALDSDEVLEELERIDLKRRVKQKSAPRG